MSNDLITTALAEQQVLERFEDFAFFAKPDTHTIHFVVLKIVGECTGEAAGVWCFENIQREGTNTFPSNPEEADVVLHGFIKWDGCSNWDFHDRDCMIHFCGFDEAGSLGRLIEHFYKVAAERVPNFDREIAGMGC